MDDNKFWLSVWSLVAAVVVSLIVGLTYTAALTRDKWEKAVTNGADPMVTSCALGLATSGHAAEAVICNTLAQNRK